MSRRGTVKEKTAKSNLIYRNRLVNMLVNHIMKHGKKIIGLSNSLLSHEKDSTKDKNKSIICFASSNTIHTRKSTCYLLVIRSILKTSRLKYGFQIKFRIGGCCQREWQ
ncbi:hypothetical protein NC652_034017 [Populus alba x Populus x berolinensis]|uniref:Ribosomal protein S7 n=1 Tax=Populus alba x Populus x berolinensis TaxID=444605 RepID=A0AAD6LV98_9ROSI|nr:hypothetical protein NC652_034017 [Populus alba x Populus x berolinensis]KAJ6973735.1 hypothetical protein NC653_033924 [Populus alba x Populus x berolinensis]